MPWGTQPASGSISAVGRSSFAVISCPGFMPSNGAWAGAAGVGVRRGAGKG
jgi:hypothetical protein